MSEGSLNGKVISEIGVSMAVERLLRAGFQVAVPIVDDGYDLLAFSGRRFWRIQVKATAISTCKRNRSRIRIGRGKRRTGRYTAADVDAFVVVNIATNVVMCVPIADAIGKSHLNWSSAHKYGDLCLLRSIPPLK